MASKFVCPNCGSSKIAKEQECDDDYYCDSCFEFFTEPKEITDEKPNLVELPQIKKEKEVKTMAYPKKIDDEKLKELVDDGKCDQEIAEFFNVNKMSVYNNRRKLGLYGPRSYKKKPSNDVEKQEIAKQKKDKKHLPVGKKNLTEIKAIDLLREEKKLLKESISNDQKRMIRIDQAIEILSA